MVRTFLLDFNQMIDEKVSDSAKKGFFETMEAIDELTQKMN